MKSKRAPRPPVQRPMILDVLPADLAPRLDVLPTPLLKRIMHRMPRPLRHWWVPVGAVVVVAGAGLLVWRPWLAPVVDLPTTVANQITSFTPYYFPGGRPPASFTVDTSTISFSDGVLFFRVNDHTGDSFVVSEQALPPTFANTKPQGDQTVAGVDGHASISTRDDRMVGSFITAKKPQALISVVAPAAANGDAMQQVMRSLKAD